MEQKLVALGEVPLLKFASVLDQDVQVLNELVTHTVLSIPCFFLCVTVKNARLAFGTRAVIVDCKQSIAHLGC